MKYTQIKDRPKTYLIDIDGTIIRQSTKWEEHRIADVNDSDALPGSVEKINELYTNGHTIILTTARCSAWAEMTYTQLVRVGLQFHEIIFDLPTGQRVLINDHKHGEPDVPMAIAVNIRRDVGLLDVEL